MNTQCNFIILSGEWANNYIELMDNRLNLANMALTQLIGTLTRYRRSSGNMDSGITISNVHLVRICVYICEIYAYI